MTRKRLGAAISALVAAIGLTVLVDVTSDNAGHPQTKVTFGVKLNPAGQTQYEQLKQAAAATPALAHNDLKSVEGETPPATVATANQQTALEQTYGGVLATPEPQTLTQLVRNYSGRNGARPAILVVHTTESPDVHGTADLLGLAAWFNNPNAQASSNYGDDLDGNTILMVPDTQKAWTQAYFNPWSISVEQIGRAAFTPADWANRLPEIQATARIFASEATKWGIPIRRGAVSGCSIIRSGIVTHNDLGQCGGGHHDPGAGYPLDLLIKLTQQYAAPPVVTDAVQQLRARTGYYAWLAWTLGERPWKGYRPSTSTVRPHVPALIPGAWWTRRAAFVASRT